MSGAHPCFIWDSAGCPIHFGWSWLGWPKVVAVPVAVVVAGASDDIAITIGLVCTLPVVFVLFLVCLPLLVLPRLRASRLSPARSRLCEASRASRQMPRCHWPLHAEPFQGQRAHANVLADLKALSSQHLRAIHKTETVCVRVCVCV